MLTYKTTLVNARVLQGTHVMPVSAGQHNKVSQTDEQTDGEYLCVIRPHSKTFLFIPTTTGISFLHT